MAGYVCAVADCTSNSTLTPDQHPFMKEVQGWARFPPTKKDGKRRRLWERRCRRGDQWRAGREHVVCSRHFLAWDHNRPSPRHPDPVLFGYNGWGKNGSHSTIVKNTPEQNVEPCSVDADTTPSDGQTERDDSQPVLLCKAEDSVSGSAGVQDGSEGEVCSDEHKPASPNTVCAVSSPAAPCLDHSHGQEPGDPCLDHSHGQEPGDPVAAAVQTDPLGTNCKSSANAYDARLLELWARMENPCIPSAVEVHQMETSARNMSRRQLFIQSVLQSDESLDRYTGFPVKEFFYEVFDMVGNHVSNMDYWETIPKPPSGEGASSSKDKEEKLSNIQAFLLTLVYLRQGFDLVMLADLFEISSSCAGIVVKEWIDILATLFKEVFLIYPSAAQVQSCLPLGYPLQYSDTRVILNRTEFFTTTPGNAASQAATVTGSEHQPTAKALIGVTPFGLISFVSKVYGGNTSDRHIFKSEFLSRVEAGDGIVVGQGFDVANLVLPVGARLHTPPATRSKSGGKARTLNRREILKTRDLARLQIINELTVTRMKKEFKLIGNKFDSKLLPQLEEILIIVAVLSNFQPPLVEG